MQALLLSGHRITGDYNTLQNTKDEREDENTFFSSGHNTCNAWLKYTASFPQEFVNLFYTSLNSAILLTLHASTFVKIMLCFS